MSADNWAVCPKCKQKQSEDIQKKEAEVQDSYGKVPVIEYNRLLTQIDRLRNNIKLPANLREDYEIGINEDGSFSIVYEANCRVCKFSFSYRHNQEAV